MIIIRLKGGLGNQMFQYALGRHLAGIHNSTLKMDIGAYHPQSSRQYAIGAFNIKENFASPDEIKSLTEIHLNKFQQWLHDLLHNHPKRPRTFIRGNYSYFNPDVLELPDNIYLEGYWQSEKYFINIADIIRSEFTVKNELASKNKDIAEIIQDTQSVRICVRRGDYVTDPKANKTHGICSLDYYYRCIEQINQNIKYPHFFVFSDDIEWCKSNLKIGFPVVFVDHNGTDKAYENLRLISQCRHNIIVNSTFSWWGAWLNPNKDKLVLAPRKWFAREDKSSKDITPDGWIRR